GFSMWQSESLSPSALRSIIRLQSRDIKNTSGIAAGYQQANVVILHKDLADDFEAFCRANSSPLPLLYRSKCGEWSCGPLTTGSDIRYLHTKVFTNRNEAPSPYFILFFILFTNH
uniref:Uncharacterized protein n=1 Tax=Sinocyclocheilus grahami TaxID=75366 RepID=A0A672SF37_SINGR